MNTRRSHFFLILGVVAALTGVAFLALPGSPIQKTPTLGLDLQGGLEVVLQAKTKPGQKLTQQDLDRSVVIMRQRVDKLGVSEPEIRKQGTDQIVIELAGVHDPEKAAEIIGKTAQLELYDLETSATGPSAANRQSNVSATGTLYDLLAGQQSKAKKGSPTAVYLFDKKKRLRAGPIECEPNKLAECKEKLLNSKDVLTSVPGKRTYTFKNGLPEGFKIFSVPEHTKVITCGPPTVFCPTAEGGAPPTQTLYYLFKNDTRSENLSERFPQMTGSDLKLSGTQADVSADGQGPEVLMAFTGKGGGKFHEITRNEFRRGKLFNNPQHFAIVLDNQIRSFPQINPDDSSLSDGIDPVNGARITGLSSLSEAKDLALVLQTGALPVDFVQLERSDISATLGKDSLNQAKKAAIGGLIVVALFLLLFYRFLGLVAVIGLAIYAAVMYAAILILDVTLTLPGFAGLILTIGVAADANVVIFERIKEEVRAGKSVRAAISAGYAKGFHTIIDANVVTAITALILFGVATAGVKGFALMLLIGTVMSVLTAVVATRAMLGLLANFKWFENPRFMGATAQEIPSWQRIDVVSRRRLWFILSLVAIGISVLAIAIQGLNLGIDFKGGVQVSFVTPKPTSLSDVRQEATRIGGNSAVVQGKNKRTGAESYETFQIRLKELSASEQDEVTKNLQTRFQAQKLGVKNVSGSFSRQILRGAILAIIVSFALIALYVTMRYRWRFAVPILRTLLNDVVITLGIYAISGREVTASTVAAILTILGFSIYDTIIVFDRVRENMKLMPKATIAEIANVSVWEVLRRSIVTSFITLLPIASLFIFGGATLKDFAFAIMIGIIIGAVSTIFIATPLLTVLMEGDPEYKRRKERADAEAGIVPGAGSAKLRWPTRPGTPAVDPGELLLEESEAALAAEPAPALIPRSSASQEKRDRRRQRRRTRPHGRAN